MKVLQTVDVIHMYNVWDKVKDFFTDSDRSELDEHTIEYFKLNVLNRSYNLLVVVEDNITIGAFLMYFMNTPTHRVLNIAAAGGKDIVVKEVADQIEQFARSQGATKIKAQAKDAQARLYKMVMGLEKTTNVVEKLLQEYAMKLMSIFNFFFNPLTWVKLTTFNIGDDGTPAPQQNTTVTTNIPDYAQPYVENMLGATQNQLFNTTTDAQGNTTLNGLKPYTPYSTNMNDYVAGFSPLQQQSQSAAGNLQTPGQFGQANQMATASGLGSLGTATTAAGAGNQYMQMAQDPNAINNFMNPYLQQSLDPALAELRRQYGITGTQEQSQATGAGAFGGSREALMAAENQRNLGTAQSQMIGQGYNNAFQAAQQAQQFGSNLGLQGQQAALQGYGQAGQAASTLGSLGTQDLAAQQSIIGTQNQIGAQQTAAEQQKINQAIQDYATAQQYPLMELGVMSNMTRGLPLSAPTTSMYQAQPTAGTQMLGAAGALGSLGAAAPKAAGGILSVKNYDVGGAVNANLERLPTEKLQEMSKEAKGIELSEIKQILADRQMGAVPGLAPGGIVAFGTGGELWDKFKRGVGDIVGSKEAAEADANAEPDKLTPFLGKAARFLAGNENAAAAEPAARTDVAPGINSTDPGIKLGADRNTYLPPISTTAGLDVPSVGEPPKELANKPAAPAAPQAATPAEDNQGIKGASSDQTSTATDPYAKIKEAATGLQDLDTKLSFGLRDIMSDPVNAPHALARFKQFQDEIDGAKEKDRQMFWLHSATMFATMATQPGGVIKAAMGALAQEIPLYVKDKEAQEKHMDDLKKAQYDITQSEIARRVGDLKSSIELKQQALKTSADIYKEIFKNETDTRKIDAEMKHWGVIERNAKEANKIQLAQVNKPSAEERIIERSMNEPKFAEAASTLKGTGPEARKYASDEGLYKAAIAAGRISDVPTDPNYMSFDDYRSGSVHGKQKHVGFTDKSDYK